MEGVLIVDDRSEPSGKQKNSDSESNQGALPERPWRRFLTIVLLVLLAISIAGVVAVSLSPTDTTDPYTEFYILGPDGNASGYPTNLTIGESGEVIVGISNHEDRLMSYNLTVEWNGIKKTQKSITVPDGETAEIEIRITAPNEIGQYRVRFLLYRNGITEDAYRMLRLWVRVSGGAQT